MKWDSSYLRLWDSVLYVPTRADPGHMWTKIVATKWDKKMWVKELLLVQSHCASNILSNKRIKMY